MKNIVDNYFFLSRGLYRSDTGLRYGGGVMISKHLELSLMQLYAKIL